MGRGGSSNNGAGPSTAAAAAAENWRQMQQHQEDAPPAAPAPRERAIEMNAELFERIHKRAPHEHEHTQVEWIVDQAQPWLEQHQVPLLMTVQIIDDVPEGESRTAECTTSAGCHR